MVQNCKTDVATDATATGIGQETARHHGRSHTVQTEAGLRLPTHHATTDQEEQAQTEQATQDEDPTEFIYQVPNCDYECDLAASPQAVKGSLKRHIKFWQNIGTSPFILDVINNGYRIPFAADPLRVLQRNNKSALQHEEFVKQAISELMQSNRIIQTKEPPHVVNPLSVSVQPSGKLRLILDLRHVNQYVSKNSVKYEDWRTALTYFQTDAFMIAFDLKSGYHHIDIHPESQKFLGFAWKGPKDRSCLYYVFTVLPFGLSSAPFIFNKCLKPLQKCWRKQGISIALCLDDGWLTESSFAECLQLSQTIRTDLREAGLITSEDKCIWQPCQELIWLGLVWNSVRGTIAITQRRIYNITHTIQSIVSQEFSVSARQLASFTGKIISTSSVTKNVSQIMTRHCSMSVRSSS